MEEGSLHLARKRAHNNATATPTAQQYNLVVSKLEPVHASMLNEESCSTEAVKRPGKSTTNGGYCNGNNPLDYSQMLASHVSRNPSCATMAIQSRSTVAKGRITHGQMRKTASAREHVSLMPAIPKLLWLLIRSRIIGGIFPAIAEG